MAELNSTDIQSLVEKVIKLRNRVQEIEYGKSMFCGAEIDMTTTVIDAEKTNANTELADINTDLSSLTAYVI